jgi:sporulation protein YlmC with PRC-barrel domain
MKHSIQFVTIGYAALMLAYVSAAQDPPASKPAPGEATRRVEKVTDLLGRNVENYQGLFLGNVKELAIHFETGEIGEVLLSNPGYIGSSQTLIGIPPSAFRFDAAANVLRLDTDREKLKLEPRFESWQWVAFSHSNRMDQIYRYKGGDAFRDRHAEDRIPWGLWRITNIDTNSRAGIAGTRRLIEDPNWGAYLGYLHRATELLGTSVRNSQYEDLGKIDNLMVDLSAGRVVAVIVASGKFLDLPGELSPIPAQALLDRRGYAVVLSPNRPPVIFPAYNRAPAEKFVLLDTTKDALDKAPHFSASQWPDFGQPAYFKSLYFAYGIERYPSVAYLGYSAPVK